MVWTTRIIVSVRYANFGLAVYHAQVLELGVVNLLTLTKIFPDPAATGEMFEPVMEQYFAQVFGRLVNEVVSCLNVRGH